MKDCLFCGSNVDEIKGYIVCKNCKILYLTKGINTNAIKKSVSEYLKTIQDKINLHSEEYHDLEQRFTLKQPLTENELKLRNCLNTFKDIKIEWEFILSNNISLSDELVRKMLYKLLVITDDLENI